MTVKDQYRNKKQAHPNLTFMQESTTIQPVPADSMQSLGGKARAAKLDPARRSAIAQAAANARWAKPRSPRPQRAKSIKLPPEANSIRKDSFLKDLQNWINTRKSPYSSLPPLSWQELHSEVISLAESHSWLIKEHKAKSFMAQML